VCAKLNRFGAYMISGGSNGGFMDLSERGYLFVFAIFINTIFALAGLYMAGSFVFPLLLLLLSSILYANIAMSINDCLYFRWPSFSFFAAVASGIILGLAAIPIAFGASLPSFTWMQVTMLEIFGIGLSWTGSDYGPQTPPLPSHCSSD